MMFCMCVVRAGFVERSMQEILREPDERVG